MPLLESFADGGGSVASPAGVWSFPLRLTVYGARVNPSLPSLSVWRAFGWAAAGARALPGPPSRTRRPPCRGARAA